MVRNDMELTRTRPPRVLDMTAASMDVSDYSGGVPPTEGIVLNQTVFALMVFGIGLAIGLAFAVLLLSKKGRILE